MNFEDALKKRTGLQHRLAVLEELLACLNTFLPTDLGPSEAILEVDDCLEPVVSQEAVEDIVDVVTKEYTKLEKELDGLSKLRITSAKKKK